MLRECHIRYVLVHDEIKLFKYPSRVGLKENFKKVQSDKRCSVPKCVNWRAVSQNMHVKFCN